MASDGIGLQTVKKVQLMINSLKISYFGRVLNTKQIAITANVQGFVGCKQIFRGAQNADLNQIFQSGSQKFLPRSNSPEQSQDSLANVEKASKAVNLVSVSE